MPDDADLDARRDALVEKHRPLLAEAVAALRARGAWSAFEQSPSTKIWGEAAPAAGKAAFEATVGKQFPLRTPGAKGQVATERSPYGFDLGISYPHLGADGVDTLLDAAARAMPAWRDAGADRRAAACVEIVCRLNARAFELAHAVMHTTGQGFVMAFQAGGATAFDRALEAIATTYDAMGAVPASASWERARGRGTVMSNRYAIVPRGIALVIGCTTFPTWNGFPGLFASLAAGNPVIVKPHPGAVLPLALTVAVARETLTDLGFDADLITLAAEADGENLASALAMRPQVRVIDFTGSSDYGSWLCAHAGQALVFAEKSGVNSVILDSTDDLAGMAANLAYSLALYSGQMCTTPQVLLIPRDGIVADGERISVDDVVATLSRALDELLGSPGRATAILGAIVNDAVLARLEAASKLPGVVIASKSLRNDDFLGARVRTPLIVRVGGDDVDAYGHEQFGPIAFVVETNETAHSLDLWRSLTNSRGALTASVYSTSPKVLEQAEAVALDCGVSMSSNLTGDVYVNQTSAFSDFHGTGANPAATASLTDLAFVAGRFRVVQLRRPA